MSASIIGEEFLSRSIQLGSQNGEERSAVIQNATSNIEAINTAIANTTMFPNQFTTTALNGQTWTFVQDNVKADPLEVDTGSIGEPRYWKVTMQYKLLGLSPQPYATNETFKTFEIGFRQVNKKNSIATINQYAPSGQDIPNFQNLIGVTNDSVEGVNLDVPTFSFSITKYFSNSYVTDSYINAVYGVANAPINDDTFLGFAAYEVKFAGLQGTQRYNGGDWELNFKFFASPNVTSDTVGTITGIAHKGWEYVWLWYGAPQSQTVGSSTFLIYKARVANVEKVYKTSDFSVLGL